MTFASTQDLVTRYGQQEILLLADRDGDGQLDPGVVEEVLADAEAELVSELAGSVSIDALSPSRTLIRLSCQIARYRLYGSNPTEAARDDYLDALKFLGRVRKGEARLDGGDGAPTEVQAPSLAAATEPGIRIFNRGL